MHAPPSFHLTVKCFGIWRGALAILGLMALGSQAAWMITVPAARSGFGLVGLPATLLVVALIWMHLRHLRATSLRWDAQRWYAGAADKANDAPPGTIHLAMDMGFWMLLRFAPEGVASWRGTWLPVQRRGHEAQWHGLRCAVHGARVAPQLDEGF